MRRSMIAIWSIREPSLPQKILTAMHEITTSCFGPVAANMVFAGHADGSLCVWDLREKSHCHQRVDTEHREWVLRSPTYNTGKCAVVTALLPDTVAARSEQFAGPVSEVPSNSFASRCQC
jgi:hypothetical protein